jgi:DNA polymerase-3 subunit epsilon/CBS domain-containing protein
MAAADNATPLIALEAIAIDTETTGLDPRKAWIVELAAVRIGAGRVLADPVFRRLVRPPEPMPRAAAEVHGLDDTMLADAPPFVEAWPDFAAFIATGPVVIGHAIGFDLAVLRRECERAGIAWTRPRTLDTLLLAEVAAPDLAEYSLDSLASWLGIEIVGRHSGVGDARACAELFLALVPRLRQRGIRTLAEAEQACRALTEVLDQHHRAGWVEPVEAPARADREAVFSRIDSYPYRHQISEIMQAPPRMVASDTLLRDALACMTAERISSLFVHAPGADPGRLRPADFGIVTERDILRVLAQHGPEAFGMPVSKVMSTPLAGVPADAFVYRAIGRMGRLGVRHLGAVDEAGVVIGVVSARDLLRLRAGEAVTLGDAIDQAEDVSGLAAAWATLPRVAAALMAEKVSARNIAAVISRELGALTRQAAVIAEARMREAGLGDPPCRYAVAVLGSAGRGESLLAMDQDNALFFASGDPDGPEDRWFAQLGTHLAAILNDVGLPFCKGGVMGKTPEWRGSVATWRARIAGWVRRSKPQDLLSVDIFFDLRPVYGDPTIANDLRTHAFDAAKGEMAFAKLLAESAGAVELGLGFFGGFRTQQGRIDLKRTGIFPIVTAARALAIRHHVVERSTPERLASMRNLGIGGQHDLQGLVDALGTCLDLVLGQQLDDLQHGTPASNAVAVKRLAQRDRERLRLALETVAQIDWLTRDLLLGR